jgi:hypothetical protein
MQFTLPKLFLIVALTAVACAAMLSPTHPWATAIATLTIVMFGFAAIRAIQSRARDRVFAIVFATAGFGYLLLALSPATSPVGRSLVTNYPIAWFVTMRDPQLFAPPALPSATSSAYLPPAATPASAVPMVTTRTTLPNGTWVASPAIAQNGSLEPIVFLGFEFDDQYNPVPKYFLIGHCVWSWLIALLAGWFAGRMYAKRQPAATQPLAT